MKFFLLLFVGFSFPYVTLGQGETTNWYFGNGAGINFNDDGSVTALSNGKLNTFEGCASLSDSFGRLLFYTDGITVYNSDHEIMENGNGLFGDPSSTQSALIVPKPNDDNLFYVFTVDTKTSKEDPDRGLNYSIVDISLNNGNGAVIDKNIPLLSDCSEKITAVVKDCNANTIWLVTFASREGVTSIFNTFHAFEISNTGVSQTAVKSTFSDLSIEDPRGYLKIAPDGKKLVNANMSNGLFIYDFDATTGVVSNQQRIPLLGTNTAAYGVEFSSNNQFLYIHASNDLFTEIGHQSSLIQFDLLSPNISASKEVIDNRNIFRGALQLASNGKIYRTIAKSYSTGAPYLSVIHNPNKKGSAANYEHNAISLNGKNATQGLPPFIQSFFNKVPLVQNNDNTKSASVTICVGKNLNLKLEPVANGIYSWKKNGIPLSHNSNSLEITSATVEDAGKYQLTITTNDANFCTLIGEALIEVTQLPTAENIMLEQCDIDTNITDGITSFNLNQISKDTIFNYTFYKNLQAQNSNDTIRNPENYTNTIAFNQTLIYRKVNSSGCENFGELLLKVNPTTITDNIASPILLCDDNPSDQLVEATFDLDAIRDANFTNRNVAFYKTSSDAMLEENPVDGLFKTSTTTLFIRIENNNNQCQEVESIELRVHPLPQLVLANTTYQVCTDGEPLIIDAPEGFDAYNWYKTTNNQLDEIGSTSQIQITESGTYRLTVGTNYQSNGQTLTCTTSNDLTVITSNKATFQDIEVTDFSENSTIAVTVSGEGDYEYSLDGINYQNEPFFDSVTPNFYTLFVRDKKGCGISETDVAVVNYPKYFTPNNDGINDSWQLVGLGSSDRQGRIVIFDRYGRLVHQMNISSKGWNGTLNGKLLPTADYWFELFIDQQKNIKGHFTLKR